MVSAPTNMLKRTPVGEGFPTLPQYNRLLAVLGQLCVILVLTEQPLARVFVDILQMKQIILLVAYNVVVKAGLPDVCTCLFVTKTF